MSDDSQQPPLGHQNARSRRTARVTCRFRFESAHRLPLHAGKCKELHGHSYLLEVTIGGEIGSNGMVMDFADIESVVDAKVVSLWDHRFLNELYDNPTAENLAWQAFDNLTEAGLRILNLRLWETDSSYVEVAG